MSRTLDRFFVALVIVAASSIVTLGQTEQTAAQIPRIVIAPQKKVTARVVAIRRVRLIVRDVAPENITEDDRRPYVEIELYVGRPEFNTQLAQLVRIGDREFSVNTWKAVGESYNAMLLITGEEFEELADGSEIYFRLGEPIEEEKFKKMYADGKLGINPKGKVGILDKKMIDLEPAVEKRAGWTPPY